MNRPRVLLPIRPRVLPWNRLRCVAVKAVLRALLSDMILMRGFAVGCSRQRAFTGVLITLVTVSCCLLRMIMWTRSSVVRCGRIRSVCVCAQHTGVGHVSLSLAINSSSLKFPERLPRMAEAFKSLNVFQATQSRVQLACDSAEHLDAWLEAGCQESPS